MQLISSQEAFCDTLPPTINYSLKQPQLLIKNCSNNIEIFEIGYFKQIYVLKPPQSVNCIQTFQNLIFLTSSTHLLIYQNFNFIAYIPLQFEPLAMILEIHDEISEKVEILEAAENQDSQESDQEDEKYIKIKTERNYNVFMFGSQLQTCQVSLQIDENMGNFMLQEEDYQLIDLTEVTLENEFEKVNHINIDNQTHVLSYGNSVLIFDCYSREIKKAFMLNDSEFKDVEDLDEFQPKMNKNQILHLTKSTYQQNIIAVQLTDSTHFLNISETAKKLTILKANFDSEHPKNIVLLKNKFLIFTDNYYQEYDLKTKTSLNKFKFIKRHNNDCLLKSFLLVSPKGLEDEINILTVFTNQIHIYCGNELKLERILPGTITNLLFTNQQVTKHYDNDLTYINYNMVSNRIFRFQNCLVTPLALHKVENQNFALTSLDNLLVQNDFLFGTFYTGSDQFVFKNNLKSGAFERFYLPGGRISFQKIVNEVRSEIKQKMDPMERQSIFEDKLARHEKIVKFGANNDVNEKISCFQVKYNIIGLCGNGIISVQYMNQNELFSEKIGFDPEVIQFFIQNEDLKLNWTQTEFEMIYENTNKKIYEKGVICFDRNQYCIFDALNGHLIAHNNFSGVIENILAEGEQFFIFDNQIVVISFNKLSIINFEINPDKTIFRLQRSEELPEDLQITVKYIKLVENKLYLCSGAKFIYFDIITAAFYEICSFSSNITSFDYSQGFYLFGFEDKMGAYFYIEDCNKPAKRYGQPIQVVSGDVDQKTNGRKMLEYLQGNTNTQVKMTKKTKAFQPVQGQQVDFLREEDVLFIEGSYAEEVIKTQDVEGVIGSIYLFGKYRSEVYQNDEVKAAIQDRKQEIQQLIDDNVSINELMQGIVDVL